MVFIHTHKLALVLLLAPPCFSQHSSPRQTQRMQQVIDSFTANKSFMGDVLVSQGDKPLLNEAYGYADIEWQTTDTKSASARSASSSPPPPSCWSSSRARSPSKPHQDYYPSAPPGDSVTICELLSHTAGIPNYTGFSDDEAIQRESRHP
jgi:CubicO group peptidase (beta-lactamase class C family)